MKKRIFLVFFLVLALAGCGSSSSSPTSDTPDKDITYRSIERGNYSAYQETPDGDRSVTLLTFRDPNEFNAFWAQHKANEAPMPTPPLIDFATKMVLVVLSPAYSSGSVGLQLDDIFQSAEEILVSATLVRAGNGCQVVQSLTRLFELIEIPSTQLPTSLIVTELVEDCE